MFESTYSNSWALCIGINEYSNQPKLKTAVNDASKIAKLLTDNFGFPKDNVALLVDSEATKERIIKELHNLSTLTEPDDKVFLFFAGHGTTITGYREVGFLLPVEATDHTSTYIRYEEFTKVSDIIPAKHIFFVFDACFSGLAFTRSIPVGSTRFMLDMISRKSRQAIASGKANETVADGDGPIQDHSLFAGYLINGLTGEAKNQQNILSASTLMHYLYQKVANDPNSHQTPHYGHFEGDGDFIFEHPHLENHPKTMESNILYETVELNTNRISIHEDHKEIIKLYLTEDKFRIKLEELIISELKSFSIQFNENNMPKKGDTSEEDYLINILTKLQELIKDLLNESLYIAYYGHPSHKILLNRIFSILCEDVSLKKETVLFTELRWFLVIWLLYATGIILVYKQDYVTLNNLLKTQVVTFSSKLGTTSLLKSYGNAFGSINYHQIINKIKRYKQNYAPLSEYIFTTLQPILEDLFYLGSDYESLFDKYEIITAFEYLSYIDREKENFWVPIGRFGWKYYRGMYSPNPYIDFIREIGNADANSQYLKSGLFKSNFNFFFSLEKEFTAHLNRLNWN